MTAERPEKDFHGNSALPMLPAESRVGRRFAAGKAPSRDSAGRSLPSDKDMQYVEVIYLCQVCARSGDVIELAGFGVETRDETFSPGMVYERRRSRIVERDPRVDDTGREYIRFKMQCPGCRSSPILRSDKADAELEEIYKQGARGVTVRPFL